MAFQVKDFRSIVASMVNYMRNIQSAITDFNVGSVARTLVEAPAVEIDELYQQMFNGLYESVPAAVYSAFGFGPLPAYSGSGSLTFTLDAVQAVAITIVAGSRVSDGSQRFLVLTDLVIPAGSSSGTVSAAAETPGIAGNVAAGTITQIVDQVDHVVSVNNASAFVGGADVESDESRRLRFLSYVSTLPRGTVAALKYGASLAYVTDSGGVIIESVKGVSVVEPYLSDSTQPVGLVNLYVHNGVGNTSANIVSHAQSVINGYIATDGTHVPGWKAAGVIVNVHAATDQPVNVSGEISVLVGYSKASIAALAVASVTAYLQSLSIGASALRSEIISAVMAIEGVYNVSLSAPATDVTVTVYTKVLPGTVAFT